MLIKILKNNKKQNKIEIKKIRTKSDRKKNNLKGCLKDKKKLLIPNQRDVSQKCYPMMKRLS